MTISSPSVFRDLNLTLTHINPAWFQKPCYKCVIQTAINLFKHQKILGKMLF